MAGRRGLASRVKVKAPAVAAVAVMVVFLLSALGPYLPASDVKAEATAENGAPTRKVTFQVEIYEYVWWINRWKDNEVLCVIAVDHPGPPASGEVFKTCGSAVHEDWVETTDCTLDDKTQCAGVYMHLVGEGRSTREMVVELPAAEAWLTLENCTPAGEPNACASLPNLRFSGSEPLPNETIIRIQVVINGEPFACPGGVCDLPLQPTAERGMEIEFWAVSSFGDESPHYTAFVRVIPWGDFPNPDGGEDQTLYYVDVLSSQWRGNRAVSCAETWGAFPPVGGLPLWLTTPPTAAELTSDQSYYYLAAKLINSGAADVSGCPSGGLVSPMAANACGLERTREQVLAWQNQFDQEILRVAQDTGTPGQLLKNIFERESQFWPGIYQNYKETGLGQMTELGADVILLWNSSFFDQFCPLVLSSETCSEGFNQLEEEHKDMLRGALVVKVNADCPTCPTGIDLTKANFSVGVFAETLLANCGQAGKLVEDFTDQPAGFSTSYEDLWRFTLVNYNAGAGCLQEALQDADRRNDELNWENVSRQLDPACMGAIDYVEEVALEAPPEPPPAAETPTPGETPTATPEETPSPQPDPDDFQG